MPNLHQDKSRAEKAARQLSKSSSAEVIPFTARVPVKEVEVYSPKAAPPESLVPNTAAIKSHVEMLHTLAQNANVDGILTFTRITDKAITERFAIGDADQMTDAIIAWSAHTNLNLYMPPVIFRKDLPHSSKGKEQDVLAVLALVGDLDSDIGKKAVDLAGLPLQAPYVVETSKGNYHATYPLARALVPSEAKPIAIALSKAIGGDSGTSDISHLWRIPGTLNWPNKKKLERGRSPLPQPVTVKQAWNGERVEPAAMWEAVKGFAETAGGSAGKSKSKGSNGSTGGSTETFSDLPADLQKLIASLPYDGEDRSKTAGCVAWKLFGRGWSNDAVVALFEEYSNGIGQRYPKDKNLREEIERLRQKFNEKPTGPLPNDIITEDSAAVEFVEKHGEHLRFCHSTGSWYNWNGVYWAKDQTTIVFQWARELVRQLAQDQDERKRYITNKTSFASGVERFAKGDPKIAVTVDYWDSDQWLLGTPGGTVDLRTGLLRDSQRHDGITKITSVAPLDSGCPQWLQFLKETTADDKELIRFLQQWCGYGLTGSIREHALVFVYGPGGNGKGVFVNVVTKILGDYVATAAMDTFTASHSDKHPTDLAKLRGARLVTASETEEGRAWAESRIKQMTGGDRISARFMRQDFFEYDPQFKLTIIGNHKPVLRNVDDAAKRRFLIVPFEKKPKVPDLNLEEKLLAEAPAILQWMISGCLDWQVNGLVKPPIVVTATDEYFADQDLFAQWLGEACECDPGNKERHRHRVVSVVAGLCHLRQRGAGLSKVICWPDGSAWVHRQEDDEGPNLPRHQAYPEGELPRA